MTRFVDAMYVENVRQWTKTKMQAMVEKGYRTGGTVPFGYTTVVVTDAGGFTRGDREPPKRLVIQPDEAEVVRLAFVTYAERRSYAVVRNLLNAMTDRNWTTDTTKYLLTNEVYLGVHEFGQWRNEQAHEAILERDLWDTVQALIRGRQDRRVPRINPFTFYLQGSVKCPHCRCSYTSYSAKRGQVRYYACVSNMKQKTECPVGRINAAALHDSVLREIERIAKHHTVAHKVIAQSGGWQEANEELKMQRGALGKKKQFVELQIKNLNTAIMAGSKNFRSLLKSLEVKEKEQEEITQELDLVEREIRQSTLKRPTAEQVQEVFGQVVDLWGELTEAERVEVLGGLVREVQVKEKERVLLELSPIAEGHAQKYVTRQIWERVVTLLRTIPPCRLVTS